MDDRLLQPTCHRWPMADGLAPFDVTLWVGFFAPRRTPREIVARLNSEINEVLAQPEVKQRLLNEGAIVLPMSVDQFTSFVKAEGAKYERIIKETGLKPE